MLGLATTVGQPGTTTFAQVSDPVLGPHEVLLRPLQVGVCGTDREIAAGLFGVAPDGEERLVLGHELLARVALDGHGFREGDLVCATVRRSCRDCLACEEGYPDSCMTGEYSERGITRLHGFATELAVEAPEHLIAVPKALGPVAVLAEPASVCARGIRHAEFIGGRQPWAPRRALVLGAGAIGVIATYLLRMRDYEVWTAAKDPPGSGNAELVRLSGAEYFSTSEVTPGQAAAELGGFDLVLEATGDSQVMLDALSLLSRNGVACLLGIDGRPRRVSADGQVIGVDTILQNHVLFGSINAHREDWITATRDLMAARRRWPDAVESFVGLTVDPDAFAEAFAYQGVKATLAFGAM